MKTVIGIDVGISTTKIVGIRDGKVISPIRIKATDPVTSLYGAFGKYINENNLTLCDIEHVMLTGVGAAYIKGDIYGLPTDRTDEFVADGLGAQYESGLDRMIVVSMGTGTTLVKYDNGAVQHIGGIGIGGGTLAGLSRLLLGTDDIKHISSLAKNGNISKIDLQIGDICAEEIPGLPAFATASLFGNAKATSTHEDIALGIICT
ncbi:MAG: pantothenate kinase, partial [Prevotella sp.]|nr:pantothenate kinase [Prevotella sp.]